MMNNIMHGYNMVGLTFTKGVTWNALCGMLFVCLFVVVILEHNSQYVLFMISWISNQNNGMDTKRGGRY